MIGWQETTVAIVMVSLTLCTIIVAIIRYKADEALKVCSALGVLLGVICGAMSTYFFTRSEVATKTEQADNERFLRQEVQEQRDTAAKRVVQLESSLGQVIAASEPRTSDPHALRTLFAESDPATVAMVRSGWIAKLPEADRTKWDKIIAEEKRDIKMKDLECGLGEFPTGNAVNPPKFSSPEARLQKSP